MFDNSVFFSFLLHIFDEISLFYGAVFSPPFIYVFSFPVIILISCFVITYVTKLFRG